MRRFFTACGVAVATAAIGLGAAACGEDGHTIPLENNLGGPGPGRCPELPLYEVQNWDPVAGQDDPLEGYTDLNADERTRIRRAISEGCISGLGDAITCVNGNCDPAEVVRMNTPSPTPAPTPDGGAAPTGS